MKMGWSGDDWLWGWIWVVRDEGWSVGWWLGSWLLMTVGVVGDGLVGVKLGEGFAGEITGSTVCWTDVALSGGLVESLDG